MVHSNPQHPRSAHQYVHILMISACLMHSQDLSDSHASPLCLPQARGMAWFMSTLHTLHLICVSDQQCSAHRTVTQTEKAQYKASRHRDRSRWAHSQSEVQCTSTLSGRDNMLSAIGRGVDCSLRHFVGKLSDSHVSP